MGSSPKIRKGVLRRYREKRNMNTSRARIIFFIICIFLCSCQSKNKSQIITETDAEASLPKDSIIEGIQSENKRIVSLKDFNTVVENKSYSTVKAEINARRIAMQNDSFDLDAVSSLFKESLLNQIIPFWEGTKWSFEGHTSVPQKGEIACGYFVSTTLRDVGLNVNRYKLAQQSPINEARSLKLNSSIMTISEGSIEDKISQIKIILKEEIYFLGFDAYHVGYIFKQDNEVYIIHSNYESVKVEIEVLDESDVFKAYGIFYISTLSSNEELLKKWLRGERVEIVK